VWLAPFLVLGLLAQTASAAALGVCGMDGSSRMDACLACPRPEAPEIESGHPSCHDCESPEAPREPQSPATCCHLGSGPLGVSPGSPEAVQLSRSASGPAPALSSPSFVSGVAAAAGPRRALARGEPLSHAPPDLYLHSFLRL
jgi:hypothetical protein